MNSSEKILEKSETLKKKVFSLSLFSYKWNPISCVENNILRWKFNSFLFTLHWFFETPILKIIASYSYIHTMYKYIRHMFKHSINFLKTKMKTRRRRRKMMYLTGIWNNKISYKWNQLSRFFFSDPMFKFYFCFRFKYVYIYICILQVILYSKIAFFVINIFSFPVFPFSLSLCMEESVVENVDLIRTKMKQHL